VGVNGTVLATTDSGVSWSTQTSGVTSTLLGIDCIAAGICVAVGPGGTVVYTPDGTAWTAVQVPTANYLTSAALLASGQAWLAGHGGTIVENSNMFSAPKPTVTGVAPAGAA